MWWFYARFRNSISPNGAIDGRAGDSTDWWKTEISFFSNGENPVDVELMDSAQLSGRCMDVLCQLDR